ncbi:SH3 domain-containing protein [Chitinibacteraceae bacterium HSL-7]
MLKPRIKHALIACLLAMPAAQAAEFVSTMRHGALLYPEPKAAAVPQWVLSQGIPLEVVSRQESWLRVRDRTGNIAWLRTADASPVRALEVLRDTSVHIGQDKRSPAVFKASAGLVLTQVEAFPNGWLRVKHRGGQQGFIRIEDVWGA